MLLNIRPSVKLIRFLKRTTSSIDMGPVLIYFKLMALRNDCDSFLEKAVLVIIEAIVKMIHIMPGTEKRADGCTEKR